jgi:hypothetical protein
VKITTEALASKDVGDSSSSARTATEVPRTPATDAKAQERKEMVKVASATIGLALKNIASATEAAVAASEADMKQAQQDVATAKRQITRAFVSTATGTVAKMVDAAQRRGYSADKSMVDTLINMGSKIIQLADKAKTTATSMASRAAASAAASTSQAVMNRLALRDAERAKQQAQQAMRALEDSQSSTGFDDPFTLHRARPKAMSFGNPFQAVGSKEFGETDAMDKFLESMQEGDANKVSKALKRLAETASPDYAPSEKRGKRTNWFVENLNKDFTPKPDDDEDLEHNVLKKRLAQSKARQLATAKAKAKAKPLGSEAIQATITK